MVFPRQHCREIDGRADNPVQTQYDDAVVRLLVGTGRDGEKIFHRHGYGSDSGEISLAVV